MWNTGWRDDLWQKLNQTWDVIVIGGGITGAGVLRLATACGLKALLLEANDFSFGTSSRSSKLVHGGFRYLFNRQFDITYESVRERQWMLKAAPHLVYPLAFVLPNYERYGIPTRMLGLGLLIYNLMGHTYPQSGHTYPRSGHTHSSIRHTLNNRRLSPQCVRRDYPDLCREGILAGFRYYDASVDDSRLVLRILGEAVSAGGTALNYARVERLLRNAAGAVCGVAVQDVGASGGRSVEVQASVVVNAAGPWSDDLRQQLGAEKRLRKLRGSHLVFPQAKFPLQAALTLFHPRDRRAMFMIPWEGVTIVGTTDIDHDSTLEAGGAEPFASRDEIEYLMEAVSFLLPGLGLRHADAVSSFAGLRPVIASGAENPSKVSRAHCLWQESGLITITGGKLTTFRVMARQTVEAILTALGGYKPSLKNTPVFNCLPEPPQSSLDSPTLNYLLGRYGSEIQPLLEAAQPGELEHIDCLPNLWAELRWAARAEGVQHLDDLMLRRVRLGVLLPEGARSHLPRIRAIAQPELGWSDERWRQEERDYLERWRKAYSPQPEA